MTYSLVYFKANGQLVYLDENAPPAFSDDFIVETRSGDMPNLDRVAWNPSMLDFYHKPYYALTKLEFMNRLTMAERIGIRTLEKVDPIAFDISEQLAIATEIRLDDPRVMGALGYFQSQGILAMGRINEILTKW
jgi:hypothetical protein